MDWKPFYLHVLDRNGKKIAGASVGERSVLRFHLPVDVCASALFQLRVDGGGHPAPNDPRIMDFRVMKLDLDP